MGRNVSRKMARLARYTPITPIGTARFVRQTLKMQRTQRDSSGSSGDSRISKTPIDGFSLVKTVICRFCEQKTSIFKLEASSLDGGRYRINICENPHCGDKARVALSRLLLLDERMKKQK